MHGGAKNAGPENAGLENAGPNVRGENAKPKNAGRNVCHYCHPCSGCACIMLWLTARRNCTGYIRRCRTCRSNSAGVSRSSVAVSSVDVAHCIQLKRFAAFLGVPAFSGPAFSPRPLRHLVMHF